jgi:hydroxymethylpyrimidine/phosphomethylpyrimidine kinase / thiaminase
MLAVARETDSHVAICNSFDVSVEELVGTDESPATTAYGAYLIDIGLRVSAVWYKVYDS